MVRSSESTTDASDLRRESHQAFPVITVLLILANLAVFFAWQIKVGLPKSVALAGLIPTELHPISAPGVTHLFTSMFMHGGIAHLLGNLWFFWIFGDNVEDEIGRIKFVFFYLLSGVAGAAAHVASNAHSNIPMVGTSGAISGCSARIYCYIRVLG